MYVFREKERDIATEMEINRENTVIQSACASACMDTHVGLNVVKTKAR